MHSLGGNLRDVVLALHTTSRLGLDDVVRMLLRAIDTEFTIEEAEGEGQSQ